MDLVDGILTRQSIAGLTAPAPSQATLDRAFRCAMAAPDHGRVRPWRFVVSEGDARLRLGQLFGDSMKRRDPGTTPEQIRQEEGRVLRAPMIVTAACVPSPRGQIPEIEQVLAVGAAVQNFCLALHAEGFGSVWRTGPAAYDPEMARALGFGPNSRVVGFIHVGTPLQPRRDAMRPSPADFVHQMEI
jgi:nitroreductase